MKILGDSLLFLEFGESSDPVSLPDLIVYAKFCSAFFEL